MKIKFLLTIPFILLLTLTYTSCDDDIYSVGGSIKPGSDDIIISFDTVSITARTVVMDSIYARTIFGLVGEFEEPFFGKLKSDYLCEFYCDNATFTEGKNKDLIVIDSVQLNVVFFDFMGDSISPMNLSVYKLNRPLERYYYTNIDPTKFYSPNDLIGQQSFSVKDIQKSANGSRTISTPLKKEIGTLLLDTWKNTPEKLYSTASLREFFPGFYVTSELGNRTMINIDYSMFDIYYNYQGKTKDKKNDSTYNDIFRLMVTPEIVQMNHMENESDDLLNNDKPDRSYIKAPTGVCTEFTIPLKEILDKAGNDQVINSAKFNLLGYTELETLSAMYRPANLLFIDKDSVDNFFRKRLPPDSKTSFLLTNSNSISSMASMYANRYVISKDNTTVGNIAHMVSHYSQLKEKGVKVPDKLTYMLIPVNTETSSSGNIISLYQTMYPTLAVLRTGAEDLKMPLVFSKYNSQNNKSR